MDRNNYFIHDQYQSRLDPQYFNDIENADEWQDDVYAIAHQLAVDNNLFSVLDIGCGSAFKLKKYFGTSQYKVTGTDVEQTVNLLKEKHPDGNWKISNFKDRSIQSVDLIICSDVIEHIVNPDELLEFINSIDFKYLVISTPDRTLQNRWVPPQRWDGPPQNPCHVREWTFDEFHNYLESQFHIHQHVISHHEHSTQCAVCMPKVQKSIQNVSRETVGILMPMYNVEKYVEEAIRSVQLQEYKNWKLFVVDNKSTDNSLNICKTLAQQDPRIIVIEHPFNSGIGGGRNVALKKIKEDDSIRYIAILDADDIWYENHLSDNIPLLESSSAGVIYSDCEFKHAITGEQLMPYGIPTYDEFDPENLRDSNFIHVCWAIMKRSVFDAVGYFDETIEAYEDWDYWCRVALVHKIPFIHNKITSGIYRINDKSQYKDTASPYTRVRNRYQKRDVQMKYSIIIPTYNHVDDLLKPCLDSIARNTSLDDVEVIVVANGCTDNTREYVESLGGSFKLLWFDEALGYTKATNEGIKASVGEYVILLNNDCEILDYRDKNVWLDWLRKPFEEDDKVAITGVSRQFFPEIRRYFLIFFCVMIHRRFFSEVGLLDEIFSPGAGEDTDWCFRAEDLGYKAVVVPKDRFVWEYVTEFPIHHKDGKTRLHEPSIYEPEKIIPINHQVILDKYAKPPKYSIIIPTYNHLDDLLRPCIDSIIENTDLTFGEVEIIVVANGCTDGTAEYVQGLSFNYPVRLLNFEEALGYTRATNEGIKVAQGEYLILLNNDTRILNFEHLKKSDWIRMLENPLLRDEKMGLTGPMQSYCPHAEDDFIIFFCCMIPKRLFNELGLLDEIFSPGFGEDTDFAMRAKQAGYKIEQVPSYETTFLDENQQIMSGSFPIFHAGEETFKHMENGDELLRKNRDILSQKWGKGNKANQQNKGLKKLNLGCGDMILDGYVNIDLYHEKADLKADVRDLSMIESESVDEIFGSHIFEHVSPYQVHDTLREWCRVLRDGGVLILELPDIEGICREFGSASKEKRYELLNCIYGTTQIEHPHMFGWYEEIIRDHLINAGFVDVIKKDPQIYHWGVNMRIEALKPKSKIDKSVERETQQEGRSMIYDCFPFSNELDVLEIRLNELYDVVDYFIIVEMKKSHTNLDKPLWFEENKERFSKFMDKIIHIVPEELPEWDGDPWTYERFQRNLIATKWDKLKDNDIVIVSDADEIPSANAVRSYDVSMGMMSLAQRLSYYKINCVSDGVWKEAKILPYSIAKTMENPCHIRYTDAPQIPNGGWHMSYLGNVKFIQEKLQEFAHHEYNTPEYNSEEIIRQRMEQGLDLYGREDVKFKFTLIDNSFPKFVYENADTFIDKGLIHTNRKIHRRELMNFNPTQFYQIFTSEDYKIHPSEMKGKVVFDIGANIGFFSLYAYESGASRVVAFEPQKENFDNMVKFVSKYSNIEVHKIAVVGSGEKSVKIYGGQEVASIYAKEQEGEFEVVDSFSLEDVVSEYQNTDMVLKMDCEGAEYDIIYNTPRDVIRKFETIVMDIHNEIPSNERKSEELKQFILAQGYEIVSEFRWDVWVHPVEYENVLIEGFSFVYHFRRLGEADRWIDHELLKNHHDNMFYEFFENNQYKIFPDEIKGRTVFDVGGYNGYFSLFAYRSGAKKIITFEPDDYNFATMKSLIGDRQEIELHKAAVLGKSIGTVQLYGKDLVTSIFDYHLEPLAKSEFTAPTVSFKDFVDQYDDDNLIVKFDCKGAEYDILTQTPRETIRKFSIIAVEIHNKIRPFEGQMRELKQHILSLGYEQTHELEWGYWHFNPDGTKWFEPELTLVCCFHRIEEADRRIDRNLLEQHNKSLFHEVFIGKEYGFSPQDLKDKTVIDVGANCGFFSLYAYESGAKQVIALEPEVHNYEELVGFCSQYPEIQTRNVAVVGDEKEEVEIYGSGVLASIYNINQSNPNSMVQKSLAASLANVAKDIEGNDLILKMDCEGAEYDILMNTPREIIRKFSSIGIEIHNSIEPYENKANELKDMILSMGYAVVSEVPWGVWTTNSDTEEEIFQPGLAYVIRFNRIEE
jgi:beta-1,4-mannosyl-glycoprotein beta-1,4-N-acetylglucosaminyltransferase